MRQVYLLLFLFFGFNITYTQQSQLFKAIEHLSEYIASDKFFEIRKNFGDIKATDSLYSEAIRFSEDDLSLALLSLTFTTLPYRKVPIQIPFLKTIFYYPIVSVDEIKFLQKNINLPRYFFYDSPNNAYVDKDKLAHFFGSAFLGYSFSFFDLTSYIGYFVEVIEDAFVLEATIDKRDIKINNYGKLFGDLLDEKKKIMPSEIIILYNIKYLRFAL